MRDGLSTSSSDITGSDITSSDITSSEMASSEIAALAQRVAAARGKLPLQHDAALLAVLSDKEIAAERELAEWVRAQRRVQRRRAVEDELEAEERDRRTAAAIRKADDADARWHRRALAARRRVSNQDARLAQLYRRAEWSSRALIAVVVLGMVWAGVNVQHNLVPSGDMTDPLYWLSYGIEAMISIPIITIMVAATTAARWGRELARGKVIFFETALLGTTIALNAGPHLASGALGRAAEYAIAPVMVGVVIWLHAWVSARYALLIDSAPVVDANDAPIVQPSRRVATPVAAIPRDEPADLLELLAAREVETLIAPAPVESPAEAPASVGRNGSTPEGLDSTVGYPLRAVPLTRRNGQQPIADTAAAPSSGDTAPAAGAPTDIRKPQSRNGAERRTGTARPDADKRSIESDDQKSRPRNHTERTTTDEQPVDEEPAPEADRRSPQPHNYSERSASADRPATDDRSVAADPEPPADDERRFPRRNSVDVINETVQAFSADALISETDEIVAELDDVEVWAVAREIAERGLSTLPVEQLAEILTLADQSWTPIGIGNEVGVPRAVVSRALESARKVRRPYAVS